MCDLCGKARDNSSYVAFIDKMVAEDKARVEYSKKMAQELSLIGRSIYSSMNWPVKLIYPMFEARAAYAVPNNYFQNVSLDDERMGNSFAHGAMRSVFFAGERLVMLSKAVNFKDGAEFFTSYLLVHFEKGEYRHAHDENGIHVSAEVEKPMMNLVTGKTERKRINFSFVHQKVEGHIVSKEQAAASSRFRMVYERYAGGAQMKSGSMDLEGYAVTVPHFSPHPYLLQLAGQFGYENSKEFQLHVDDYFKGHLG